MQKKAISIRVNQDIIEYFKSEGPNYQTRMHEVLRAYVDSNLKECKGDKAMGKKWTINDDFFLIEHEDVGVNYVASHDLGFAEGAGKKRIKILHERGAVEAYWNMQLSKALFAINRMSDAERKTESAFFAQDRVDQCQGKIDVEAGLTTGGSE